MTKKLSSPAPTFKQQHTTPDKDIVNLLKRFAVTKRVSLLILLITVALLLAYILANFFMGWLMELSLWLTIAIPLAFIIIRLIYRQLKNTNVPLYVITLISILPVVGAIYLDYIVNNDGFFYFIAMLFEMFVALNVFSLALFLTSLGHVCYQLTMKRHGYQLSQQQIWSRWVALVTVEVEIGRASCRERV